MKLFLFSILAGILTVFSPCVLPVLPPLLGASGSGRAGSHPLKIILGLSASFTLFGVVFATFGTFLGLSNETLRKAALALLLFFGGSLIWPSLWERIGSQIARLGGGLSQAGGTSHQKWWRGIAIGASLGLIWAPCAGPILGIILTLAAIDPAFVRTTGLIGGYALGAAVPMLAIAYGGRWAQQRLLAFRGWGAVARKTLGVLTIGVVLLLYFNLDTLLLARLPGGLFLANRLEKRLLPAAVSPVQAADRPLPVLGPMPQFARVTAWINSPPLTRDALRGKVVLVDFWTYSCINCIRSLPYVVRWHEKYKDQGLVVVGVHTPEFAFEKDEGNVRAAVKRNGIAYPVAIDNDYGIWRAYDNLYWPAHYFIDAVGRIRYTHFGEGEYEEGEKVIQQLLMEAQLLKSPMKIDRTENPVDFTRIKSPETYIGYARSRNLASPEKILPDRIQNYSSAANLLFNQWDLAGPWRITEEYGRLEGPGGKIRFKFLAPKLNLVMQGPRGKPAAARVFLDGQPVSSDNRGADVSGDGRATVGESLLYNLISLPDSDRSEHLFELRFDSPGVELYAFTFG